MGFTCRYVSTSCKLRQISVIDQRTPLIDIKMSREKVEVVFKNSNLFIIGSELLLQISWCGLLNGIRRNSLIYKMITGPLTLKTPDSTHTVSCVRLASYLKRLPTNSRNKIEDLPCGEYRQWHNEKTRLTNIQISD